MTLTPIVVVEGEGVDRIESEGWQGGVVLQERVRACLYRRPLHDRVNLPNAGT